MGALIVEVFLGLFFEDYGVTDSTFEFGRTFLWILDDVNEIAAKGKFVDEVLDLQR